MSNISRYVNGHVLRLYAERTELQTKIAQVLGGLSEQDFADFDKFAERVDKLSSVASNHNCHLYVDAEQTFIQAAIESFGQQMTHKLNVGGRALVMNGYQCYLKRMAKVIPMEVRASHEYDYSLGVKLIRGAYMNEEREIAAKAGLESPVWESLEETHACYNANMQHIIGKMRPKDLLLVASHNQNSCELAKDLAIKRDLVKNVRFGQLKGFSD